MQGAKRGQAGFAFEDNSEAVEVDVNYTIDRFCPRHQQEHEPLAPGAVGTIASAVGDARKLRLSLACGRSLLFGRGIGIEDIYSGTLVLRVFELVEEGVSGNGLSHFEELDWAGYARSRRMGKRQRAYQAGEMFAFVVFLDGQRQHNFAEFDSLALTARIHPKTT